MDSCPYCGAPTEIDHATKTHFKCGTVRWHGGRAEVRSWACERITGQATEEITRLHRVLRSCGMVECSKCGAWKRPICICDDCGGE